MNKIRLKNIKIYSNHGCLEEEKSIGSDYLFQLEVTSNLYNSSKSDNLEDTIDYVSLHNIISEEALKRSKLLENIAKRIKTVKVGFILIFLNEYVGILLIKRTAIIRVNRGTN